MTKPKPPAKGLVFYPNSHRYRLDGRWVQGVTTLIKGGLPKDALMYWSARRVAEYVADERDQIGRLYGMGRAPMVAALKEIPWQSRDEKAERGSEVHHFAQRIARGEEIGVGSGEGEVPESLVPFVESCIAFLDEYDIEPILSEAAVGSRKGGYGGKLDLIANDAIWDYKTGSGIYPDVAFQNAAYAFADFYDPTADDKDVPPDEHPMPAVERSFGVHLRSDGYDVYPLEFGQHVFDEFLAITEVARIAKRAKGDRQTPGYVKPALQPEWD